MELVLRDNDTCSHTNIQTLLEFKQNIFVNKPKGKITERFRLLFYFLPYIPYMTCYVSV